MTSDPVLRHVKLRDLDLHDRIVEVLVDSVLTRTNEDRPTIPPRPVRTDLGESLAAYECLSSATIRRLAGSSNARVKRALASNQGCPPDLLDVMAADTDDDVRKAAASNPSSPASCLMMLASDPSVRVREAVFTNAAADDGIRATVVLSSAPDEVTSWQQRSLGSEPAPGDGVAPQGTRSDLLAVADMPAEWHPDGVTPIHDTCRARNALWRDGRAVVWPSTAAFVSPATPQWVLEALTEHGHPAGLLHADVPTPRYRSDLDPSLAVKELVDSGLLIRGMWREMVLLGVIELAFVPDYLGWPHLLPRAHGKELLKLGSAAEYVISGGQEGSMRLAHAEEWVMVTNSVSLDSALVVLAELFDSWLSYGLDDESPLDAFRGEEIFPPIEGTEPVTGSDDLFALAGLAYIRNRQELTIVTAEYLEAVRALDVRPVISEPRDLSGYEFETTVGECLLPWISYAGSGEEKMHLLVDLLTASRTDVVLGTWGVSQHFLTCIAMHPATPDAVRARCNAEVLLDDT